MDGAHRPGRAAVDPRRRQPDHGLRVQHRHRPGQHLSRPRPTSPTRSTTSPPAPRPPCWSWPRPCPRSWARTSHPSSARSAQLVSVHVSPGRRRQGDRRDRLHRRDRSGRGPPSTRRLVAGDALRSDRRDHPGHEALAGRRGGRRRHRRDPLRLGGPGPEGRRVRAGLRRMGAATPTVWPSRAARPACTWRWSCSASGRETRSSSPRLSFIATTNVVRYVGATPVFADVDARHPEPHRRDRARRPSRPAPAP